MTDLRNAPDVAREIAAAALGRDPGPMGVVESLSHRVYVGADVVVKIIEAGRHSRLDREIALSPHLPAGLTAPLLASGLAGDIRYACYTRMPGVAPGMGLAGLDATTACRLAEEAVEWLGRLHRWKPGAGVAPTLREPLDHGGFAGRPALLAEIDALAAAALSRPLLDGLTEIARRAPARAGTAVPVHADCHWGNWLASGGRMTALLDFEWARFGEPADDWFFLITFSGPHLRAVLDVVARATATPAATLRAACELRGATFVASDLLLALTDPEVPAGEAAELRARLEEIVLGRAWWRET